MSRLAVDLKVGDTLKIGDASIRLEKKSGQLARLVVDAPLDTVITTPQHKGGNKPNPPARMSAPPDSPEQHSHGKHAL